MPNKYERVADVGQTKDGVGYGQLEDDPRDLVSNILATAPRSPSYFVLKRMLMFMADLIAGSKSLIFWETSIASTPFFL